MDSLISYGDGIYAVDGLYVRPRLAAIHLVVERGRALFFDSGTNSSLPQVLAALAALRIAPEAVDYVIPSHVHLDHAGGAGAMMRCFPNARLVAHPRGARHLAAPAQLVAGVAAVYGEAATRALYGEILPISSDRIVEAADGMALDLAGRTLTLLDTPGHARHHVCLHDGRTGHIFTGDMFGLSYRELDVDGRASIFPTTTPVQFDPEAMRTSIDRLLALRPDAMYLTHFGRVGEVERLGRDLHRLLDAHCEIALQFAAAAPAARHAELVAALRALLLTEKQAQGWRLADNELLEIFATDLELNAQGLGVWLDGLR